MNAGRVRLEIVNDVAVVTLDRPEKLNALDLAMWRSLSRIVGEACRSSVKGIVVTGSGRAFSTGDDIGAMYSLSSDREAEEFFSTLASALDSIIYCEIPIAASVNGVAAGGGAEMLLLADWVVAVENTIIMFPEARLKLYPPILLSVGVRRLGAKAYKLALTGDPIDAPTAASIGLVDELAPKPEAALKRALISVRRIWENTGHMLPWSRILSLGGPEAVSAMKDLVLGLSKEVLKPEAKEAMRAFLEKRLRQ